METWQALLVLGFWAVVAWGVASDNAADWHARRQAALSCSCPNAIYIQKLREWRLQWNPKCEVHPHGR